MGSLGEDFLAQEQRGRHFELYREIGQDGRGEEGGAKT